ncbi:MAG: (R,R)-butanediol dehydrogenase / meso-butanediol dehydrogenase / diacetyl reductase [Actinomycetota bacterium]|jgi:(R,R)-butanediol dehydrogenase/meso-butanediol dehydrogenase/diacetyl reductase
MRAVAFTADGTLEVLDKPEPTPGPHDVVVAVERCGICGSDLHLKAAGLLPPGAVMGHEFGGRVVAVGDAVDDIDEGQRVAVLPADRDRTCAACEAGKDHLCGLQFGTGIGLGMHDGGYAELVRAPARSCFVLPEGMTSEQAALVEPFAVALHAVRRSRAAGGRGAQTVGIIGAGPIGLFTLAALRREGVTDIAVAERNEGRAAIADRMGATTVVSDAAKLGAALGEPPEVVFDCAGVTATPPLALEIARMGGQVVLVGVVNPGDMLAMPGLLWVVKEVDVVPSIAYTIDEFAESVDAVAARAVDPDIVVSDVRPLEAAEQSFHDLVQPDGPVKVLLSPSA